jgi:predicted signal transduction protein with EAL and GGDEF domain
VAARADAVPASALSTRVRTAQLWSLLAVSVALFCATDFPTADGYSSRGEIMPFETLAIILCYPSIYLLALNSFITSDLLPSVLFRIRA